MNVARGLGGDAARRARSVVLAVGVFDGVHLGHRRIIGTVVREAARRGGTAALLTFDPHPLAVVGTGRAPRLLTTIEHRLLLLGRLGLDLCIVVRFDRRLAALGPGAFVERRLARSLDLAAICVGPRFRFGRRREGTTALLRGIGARRGFDVVAVGGASIGGVRVSSTAVRRMVRRGEIARASRFLGRPYSIYGTVVRGKALGRALGVPTANIDVAGELLPPAGVYTASAAAGGGAPRPGVLNIDFDGGVEVHLLGFSGDLYGERLEIAVGRLLRRERRFRSAAALARRIRCDIEIAARMLHNHAAGPHAVHAARA
ncbi:MAG: riboflavin biosynthesis protein RibF [bacterium]|nr:riboflavin biosynthesis protein RibF [bacterium]